MTVFYFVIGCLAAFRLTVMVVKDSGPWGIFSRLRKVTRLSKLLSCVYCTSIWVGAAIEAGFFFSGVRDAPVVMILLVLAFSAIAIILDRTFCADVKPA